jgi:hypothetical protein
MKYYEQILELHHVRLLFVSERLYAVLGPQSENYNLKNCVETKDVLESIGV